MSSLAEIVRKHSLKNAFDYGKAQPGGVVGKVISEMPEAKKQMKQAMELVNKTIAEVNKLSRKQVGEELEKYSFEEKIVEEKKWSLPGVAEKKVVTRFLPEPNGFLHLGHAKAALLSRTLADQWKGKCLLRFDDTNPETEQQEFVDAIKSDLQWLGVSFDAKELYSSDFMLQFYELAEKLFEKKKAFVCTCSQEQIAANREKKRECACRAKSPKQNKVEWKSMLDGKLKPGASIVRFAGDMASENTVMRDPTLFRIVEAPHYRQGTKYRVWPTYDFEASVADSLSGVTHALRSKEYELRDELYYALLDALGLRKPVVYDFSRLNIRGNVLSKRLIKPLVESKKLLGWDDPRLLTIGGLRRRGILPQAIKTFVLSFGLSKVESAPSEEKLLVENRKLLDPDAERRFFVPSPVELVVAGHPEKIVKAAVHNHPTNKEKGVRKIAASGNYFVSGEDAKALSLGEVFRLKELYNVKLAKKTAKKLVGEFAGEELLEGRKIQWVPAEKGEFENCSLLVPGMLFNEKEEFNQDSLEERRGFCEKSCEKLSVGDVIQFERVGFARLDRKEKSKLVFVWSC